jgi:hypothetical protein
MVLHRQKRTAKLIGLVRIDSAKSECPCEAGDGRWLDTEAKMQAKIALTKIFGGFRE